MAKEQDYYNKATGQVIKAPTISSNDSDGIVYYDNGVWKFVAANDATPISHGSITIDNKRYCLDSINFSNTMQMLKPNDGVQTTDKTYYSYYFGLQDFKLSYNNYDSSCGFISEDIDVMPNTYISLSATYYINDYSNIEFYIIDGINEYPIMPIDDETIQHEKIFFKQPLRFKTAKATIYDQDNNSIYTGSDIQGAIDNLDLSKQVYTISYSPLITAYTSSNNTLKKYDNAHYHLTKNSSIKIKAILRLYNKISMPPYITKLCIAKNK